MELKTCYKCQKSQTIDNYSWANKDKGIKQKYCKECVKSFDAQAKKHPNYNKRKTADKHNARHRLQQHIVDFLEKHPCIDCGEIDPIVLEFDHRADKKFGIANLVGKGSCSIENLAIEMSKCDIRCANCHRRKTAKDFGFYKTRV